MRKIERSGLVELFRGALVTPRRPRRPTAASPPSGSTPPARG